MTAPLRVLPLGGLGEIGKNMTVVEQDGRIVVVDIVLMIPTTEMLGIDLVLPDFSYLRDHADDIEAIVLTHGHEDHVGALPYVLREIGMPPVIYGGALTIGLVRSKLEEHRGNLPRAAVELAKEWRMDRVLRRLEALLAVADAETSFIVSGTGDVIEPDDGLVGIGSGGPYALAAARALRAHSTLEAPQIAEESLRIAAGICVYTNDQITVLSL